MRAHTALWIQTYATIDMTIAFLWAALIFRLRQILQGMNEYRRVKARRRECPSMPWMDELFNYADSRYVRIVTHILFSPR